jgi:hypothetical protein
MSEKDKADTTTDPRARVSRRDFIKGVIAPHEWRCKSAMSTVQQPHSARPQRGSTGALGVVGRIHPPALGCFSLVY